jgi:hypothetical protein
MTPIRYLDHISRYHRWGLLVGGYSCFSKGGPTAEGTDTTEPSDGEGADAGEGGGEGEDGGDGDDDDGGEGNDDDDDGGGESVSSPQPTREYSTRVCTSVTLEGWIIARDNDEWLAGSLQELPKVRCRINANVHLNGLFYCKSSSSAEREHLDRTRSDER